MIPRLRHVALLAVLSVTLIDADHAAMADHEAVIFEMLLGGLGLQILMAIFVSRWTYKRGHFWSMIFFAFGVISSWYLLVSGEFFAALRVLPEHWLTIDFVFWLSYGAVMVLPGTLLVFIAISIAHVFKRKRS